MFNEFALSVAHTLLLFITKFSSYICYYCALSRRDWRNWVNIGERNGYLGGRMWKRVKFNSILAYVFSLKCLCIITVGLSKSYARIFSISEFQLSTSKRGNLNWINAQIKVASGCICEALSYTLISVRGTSSLWSVPCRERWTWTR